MKRFWLLVFIAATGTLAAPSPSMAQNVSGYRGMSEPLLFLVREPAVLNDLKLSQTQRTLLEEINHSFDGALLKSRNMPAKESTALAQKVLTATREKLSQILDDTQRTRIQQIKNRLRGISCVLTPQNAQRLGLSDRQKKQIEKIVKETQKVIRENSSAAYQGKEAHEKSQKAVQSAQKSEQAKIIGALSQQQKQLLSSLVGRSFDQSKLGRVSFKAPEFAKGDKWLNSNGKALRLEDLRGKVVALHFYAFG